MGGNKSKPRELGQHSRSLDGTVSMNSGSNVGHHHNSCQQNFTPSRTPAVDGSRHGAQNITSNADLPLFGGVESMTSLTSPLRSTLTAGIKIAILVMPALPYTESPLFVGMTLKCLVNVEPSAFLERWPLDVVPQRQVKLDQPSCV